MTYNDIYENEKTNVTKRNKNHSHLIAFAKLRMFCNWPYEFSKGLNNGYETIYCCSFVTFGCAGRCFALCRCLAGCARAFAAGRCAGLGDFFHFPSAASAGDSLYGGRDEHCRSDDAAVVRQQVCQSDSTGATIASAQLGILLALILSPASTLWMRAGVRLFYGCARDLAVCLVCAAYALSGSGPCSARGHHVR